MKLTFTVRPDKSDGGWLARCQEVPAAYGHGETEDEAVADCQAAARAILARGGQGTGGRP